MRLFERTCAFTAFLCLQNIRGDLLSDALMCLLLYPLAAVQMHDEAAANMKEGDVDMDDA
jgi:hypothetical protein